MECYDEFVSAEKLGEHNKTGHKRPRRGGKKKKKRKTEKLMVGHLNVRGIKSKIKDIISLMEQIHLDIMIFSETKLIERENKTIPGYKNHRLNRKTKSGGVIAYYKEEMDVKLIKKNIDCETVWIKVECKDNVIATGVYSPCEDNVSKRDITEFVKELEKDYLEIKENVTDNILIVGDFNAYMGDDDEGIKGNNKKIGTNGKAYRRLFKDRQLRSMNNSSKCEGK